MKIDRNSFRTFILILLTHGSIWTAVLHAREFRGGYDPTWATEPLFDSNINRGIAATSIGSDNLPQIVGMVNSRRYSGVGLEYFREIGNVWNQEIIESGLPVETIPSILDDSNPQAIGLSPTNDPRIAYIVPGIGLKFAWKNGAGNWNISTVDPLAQLFVSMKVDSSGKVHLAYFAPEKLKYGIWNGVSWSTTTVDSGGVGKFNSLALDRSNSIYISYYDHVNKDLKMASWNGINWSTQTVYSEGEAGKYSSLAINSFNNPCIAHLKEWEIYFSSWNGSRWDHEGIGSHGTEMSLAFNAFGKPEIAFNLSNSLSYVALVDTVWREWRIDESQGDNPSLGFGTDGSKHIVCGWKSIFHLTSEYFEYPTQTNLFSRTPNTITWKWNDNSTKETGFVILEASNLTPISPELPANTTYWTQISLTPNSPSEIIVRAFNPKTFVDSQISPRYWTSAEIPTIREVVKTGDNSAEVYFLSNGNSRSTLYYVEYSSDSINYTLVGPSGYPDRPYPFFNLKDGNSYNFRIRASNDENLFSPYSYFDTPLVLPNTSPPSAPTNLRIINRTTTTLTWAWDDTSLNETGFRIIRDMEILEELTSNTSNWTQGGLTPNKMERIQVLAYNDKGQALSQRLYFRPEEYTLAAKPGLSVGAVGATTVELLIDPKENPAGTNYVLEKEKSDRSSFELLFATTSLTPVVSGLEMGTYRFRVQAKNHGGILTDPTDPTPAITLSGPGLSPQPPVRYGLIFVGERSVGTQWNASQGATGYVLGVSLSNANPPKLIDFVATTELKGEVTRLDLNTTYYVFLRAANMVGSSNWVMEGDVVTYAKKPGLSVGAVGATTVGLVIDPKGNPVGTKYVVEKEKSDRSSFEMLFTTTSLTPVVTGLERGTHRFRLQAQNHRGNLTGPTDPTAEVTITGPELPPQPPVRDGVISVGERSVRTQWNASLRATGYTLGVSLSDANPPNLFNFVDTTELQGEVTGLDLNTTYYVFLKSSNTVGSSDWVLAGDVVTYATKPGLALGVVGTTSVGFTIDPKGNPAGTVYVVEKEIPEWPFYELSFSTTSLTPVISNLNSETTYRFRIQAQNHWGNLTDPTEPVTAVTLPFPPLPPTLKEVLSVSKSSVMASWDQSSRATSYTLGVSLSEGTPPLIHKKVDTVDDHAEVTDLSLNTTYYVYVKATNNGGSSDFVLLGDVVTKAEKPGLAVGAVGATSVELVIDPIGNPADTEYLVEYKQDDGDYSLKLTTTSLSLALDGLNRGSNFIFRVRAVNHNNQATDYAFTEAVRLAPAKPVRAELKSVGVDGSEVSWVSSVGAKSYKVLASKFEDDPLKDAKPFSTELSSITLTGLNPNTTYYLSVQSVNEGGVSEYLSIGRMVTLAAAPGLSLDLNGPNSIRIVIDPKGNPLGTVYEVEARKENDGNVKKITTTSLFPTIEGLESESVYQFQVRAKNHEGIATEYSPVRNGETVKPAITTVAEARAFPVPFRPESGHSSMTIDQIPIGSTIRVYTMSGMLVKELRTEAESVQWNVKNDDEEDVSSGVYIVRVSGSGGDKTFKIVVQR